MTIDLNKKQQDYLSHCSSGPFSTTTGVRHQVHPHPDYSERLKERLKKEFRHVENGVPHQPQPHLLPRNSKMQQKIINQTLEKFENVPINLPSSLNPANKIKHPQPSSSSEAPLSTSSYSSYRYSSDSIESTPSTTVELSAIQPLKFDKVTIQFNSQMTDAQKKEARRQKAQELMSFLNK